MSNADGSSTSPIRDRLLVELARLDWAKELSEDALHDIASHALFAEFRAGQVVHRPEEKITSVYFVVTGRLQATVLDQLGNEVMTRPLVRGSVLGLFSVACPDQSQLRVEAIEPSTVIQLTLSELLRLTSTHAEFQITLLRLAGSVVKQMVMVDRTMPRPMVVGVVHHCDASRLLTKRLIERLRELGEAPCVAGDDVHWRPDENTPYRLLFESGRIISDEQRHTQLKEWAARGRLFIDLRVDHSHEDLTLLLRYADTILWCIGPRDSTASLQALQALEEDVPSWRDKVRVVWILDNDSRFAPYLPELHKLAGKDFKISFDSPRPTQGSLLQHGFERIIHQLRGMQIGLALGGGAARGMAHLGVLKALEQNGIYVDMLAGTSAGAMTGTIYAAGVDPGYATRCFKNDLQPPWIFRQLPAGGYWYLLYKYRRHQFDAMLRKYLDQARLEQLAIPMITISVDLVEGEPVVRETGDATGNILESINLPPLALPIVQAGRALVDGGLLNNVPANVLVGKGCNFVLASSVTANLEKDFMNLRANGARPSRRLFSTIPVVLRQQMIQHYSMNAVGVQPADFVIAPDVTAFDISEFTRADEMAEIGERTAAEAIGKIRQLLSKLDPQLFPVK